MAIEWNEDGRIWADVCVGPFAPLTMSFDNLVHRCLNSIMRRRDVIIGYQHYDILRPQQYPDVTFYFHNETYNISPLQREFCTFENKIKWWSQVVFYFGHLIEPYRGRPDRFIYYTNLKSLTIYFTPKPYITSDWLKEGF